MMLLALALSSVPVSSVAPTIDPDSNQPPTPF